MEATTHTPQPTPVQQRVLIRVGMIQRHLVPFTQVSKQTTWIERSRCSK